MPTLSERLFKLATENAGSYLVSLNLKAISKDRKRSPTDDPRAFYENLRKEAEDGPIFSKPVIEALHLCPVELQKHEVQWLATQYEAARKAKPSAKFPDVQELRGVLDYLHQETPNLDTLTWAQAVKNSAEWHKSFVKEVPMGKYETKDVVMEFDNGWSMVKVPTEHDLDVEGEFMGHCVGGDDYARKVSKGKCTIYSLRDPKNEPHVTIEVAEPHPKKGTPNPRVEREVIQVQGKQNEAPIEKYHGMLEKFFVREGLHLQDETSGYIRDIEVLRGMVRSSDLSEIRRAAANSYLTPELAEDIYRKVLPLASKTPPPATGRKDPHASEREKQADAYSVLIKLADNPSAPTSILSALASAKDEELREQVLGESTILSNPRLPTSALNAQFDALMSRSSDPSFDYDNRHRMEAISKNPNLSASQREDLWKLCATKISRRSRGELPGWVVSLLETFAGTSKDPKRLKTISEWALSESKLGRHVEGDDPYHSSPICSALLANPSTSLPVALSLLQGDYLMRSVLNESSDDLVARIFSNPAFGPKGFTALAKTCAQVYDDADGEVLGRVWKGLRSNPAYSPKLLPSLLKDIPGLAGMVAFETPMTEDTFKVLLSEPKKLPVWLSANSSLTEDQANQLVSAAPPSYWKTEASQLAANPKLSVDSLRKMWQIALKTPDSYRDLLRHLAGNSSLPSSIQIQMAQERFALGALLRRKDATKPLLEAIRASLVSDISEWKKNPGRNAPISLSTRKKQLEIVNNLLKSASTTASAYLPLFALRGYQQ